MKAATEIMNEHKTEVNISIHAAREGGDAVALAENPLVDISIHAAREGGDFLRQLGKSQAVKKFQSTPPVKAATVCSLILNVYAAISIHAAREGGDFAALRLCAHGYHFNPRRP